MTGTGGAPQLLAGGEHFFMTFGVRMGGCRGRWVAAEGTPASVGERRMMEGRGETPPDSLYSCLTSYSSMNINIIKYTTRICKM